MEHCRLIVRKLMAEVQRIEEFYAKTGAQLRHEYLSLKQQMQQKDYDDRISGEDDLKQETQFIDV